MRTAASNSEAAVLSLAYVRLLLFYLFDAVLLVEALDTTCCVYEFLFSSKERMAGRTNFDLDVLYRRTGLDDISAGAGDGGELVLGMNTALHLLPPRNAGCLKTGHRDGV